MVGWSHHADLPVAVDFIPRGVLQLALPQVAHHVVPLPEERQVVLRNVQLLLHVTMLTSDTVRVSFYVIIS